MSKKSLAALVTTLAVGFASCEAPTQPSADAGDIAAAVTGGATSWAEMSGAAVPLAAVDVNPRVQTVFAEEGLTVVTGGPSINVVSALEDFEGANSIGITACAGPFYVHTNDACYSPEEILEGLAVDNLDAAFDPFGMVAITPEGLGLPSTVVGPNGFVDGTDMTFGYNGMQEVWFSLYAPFHGPCYLILDVYGTVGLVGQFVIWTGAGSTPAGYGVLYSPGITRMTFSQTDFCGELFDDVLLVKY